MQQNILKQTKRKFQVSVDAPEATIAEIAEYIRLALLSWCGGFRPEDPMFNVKSVTVRSLKDKYVSR
jgi:hypothetical protein